MRFTRITLYFALAGLLLVLAGPAQYAAGYGLCGYDWDYQANPMGENYRINANCVDAAAGTTADQIAYIQNGAAAWNGAGACFEFTYGGTTTGTSVTYNNINIVYFDTTPPDGGGYIAATYIWASGGNVTENDLVFNDQSYTWSGVGNPTAQRVRYLEHRDPRVRPLPLPRRPLRRRRLGQDDVRLRQPGPDLRPDPALRRHRRHPGDLRRLRRLHRRRLREQRLVRRGQRDQRRHDQQSADLHPRRGLLLLQRSRRGRTSRWTSPSPTPAAT